MQVKSQINPTVIEFDTIQNFSLLNGTGFFPFSDAANNKFKSQFISNPRIKVTFSGVSIPFFVAPAADVQEVGNRISISGDQTVILEYVGARARRKNQYGLSFSQQGGSNYSFSILTAIAPRVTASSSSSGSVSTSSSSGAIVSSSSSSSGAPKTSSSSGSPKASSSSSGFVVITSSSSSSSGGTRVVLTKSFTGIWKAKDTRNISLSKVQTQIKSSDNLIANQNNIIYTFTLCVKNGSLEGTVDGGTISQGVITSQIPITKYQINFVVKDMNNKRTNVRLNIAGKKRLLATFNNIHSVEARKVNLNKSCLNSF